jgi:hypothetical protein
MQLPSAEVITAVGSLPIATIAVYLFYRLSSNHLNHNTESIDKLTDATREQTELQREFHGWMKGVVVGQEQRRKD